MPRRVAVALLQVMLAVVLAGCGSSPTAATSSPLPSPSPTISAALQAAIAQLEAKPLKLPTRLPNGKCRPDQQDPTTALWGKDPIFAMGGPHTSSSFGDYYDVSVLTRPGLAGPVLLRARDLIAPNHPLVFVDSFDQSPYVFPTGPVYGTDPSFGPQYTELAVDISRPAGTTHDVNGISYEQWFWRQGIGFGWTGCVGFQIDSPTFSEDINVNVPTG